ncbi:MAG: hypothetical protein MI922_26365, partial [Bacteroidales bacterium]|nr:hypothetical protein [Bacteroidales bacterium]
MKKVLLSLMAVAVLFTSCEDDTEEKGPTLTLDSEDGYIYDDKTVTAGSEMSFAWTAVAGDNKLTTFSIDKDGAAITGWNAEVIPSSENDSYLDETSINAPLNVGSYVYTFTVEDKAGKTDSKSITITVETAAT